MRLPAVVDRQGLPTGDERDVLLSLEGAGVGDGPTHSGVGEHSRILGRHIEIPSKIRV